MAILGTSLVVQWLRLCSPHLGACQILVDPYSIPGQITRSHMAQLKIPSATAKTWCSQRNKYIFKDGQSEKAMAPHSSTLAWKIPWMEEPGRLQCMGSLRAGHDWATSLSLFTFLHWRRKWQPTPVFLPGESQGRRSLVGYRLRGRTESDTTEVT